MTELPVLRVGLAGFSAGQQNELAQLVAAVSTGHVSWVVSDLDCADAWLVNGAKVLDLGEKRIRINPGLLKARSIQVHMTEMDRPIGFSRPVKVAMPTFSFDFDSASSLAALLRKFEVWQSAIVAQVCLAAHIVEHQGALRSGVFTLTRGGAMLATVSMHGDISVLATAAPADFEDAIWRRETGELHIPDNFVRSTMSQLMWQYATRTRKDVLPPHYRTGAIYFRRAPRLPQRLIGDAHLLLLRELANAPATFDALLRRCDSSPQVLASDLAALYFVGSITSNPKRAANPPSRTASADCDASQGPSSNLPSGLDSIPPDMARQMSGDSDMTAPGPIGPH
ncbi:hypothetical protein [Caenimonas sp. SL110]|uniref:hypothetical protein n=1 Tax=Caenimonas sp. SL110 TaxID=1450524 RepID=UPI000653CF03|nr:hypothetical protein [Caenimonas sp. SL110]